MNESDDTVRTDEQSREDALVAMVDAGVVRGFKTGTLSDIVPETPLVVVRVARDCLAGSPEEVVATALGLRDRLLAMPEPVRGRTILSFDGWANDPRPLFEVPQVTVFCRAILFAEHLTSVRTSQECAVLAGPVLSVMFNERAAWEGEADSRIAPTYPEILDAAGSLWLSSHAFPDDVYRRSAQSPTGYVRDIAANLSIDGTLRGGR